MEKKKCTKCSQEKILDEYAYKNKSKEIKKHQCKECDKKERKKFYSNNKEKIIKNLLLVNKKKQQRNGIFVWNYLMEHPCIDCGEKNPIVLEFDHRDDSNKIKDISVMSNSGYSIDTIKNEIEKCDIRCSNCHKIRTSKQQNWYSYINQ